MSQAGLSEELKIDYVPLFIKLLLSCLAPTLAGKAARELLPPARRLAEAHGPALSIVSNGALALIIWQTISSAQQSIVEIPLGTALLIIVAALLLHAAYLIVNGLALLALRMAPPESVCVLLMASQKVCVLCVCARVCGGWRGGGGACMR